MLAQVAVALAAEVKLHVDKPRQVRLRGNNAQQQRQDWRTTEERRNCARTVLCNIIVSQQPVNCACFDVQSA